MRRAVPFAACLVLSSLATGQTVLPTDAMEKIWSGTSSIPSSAWSCPPGVSADICIAAAQNEFESFQIVVEGPASNVTASLSALSDGSGHSLSPTSCGNPQGDIRIYLERTIQTSIASFGSDWLTNGQTGTFPDALVPQVDGVVAPGGAVIGECRNAFPIQSVPSGSRAILWVETYVPQAQASGNYSGTVTVSWTGGFKTLNVNLTVWDFTLPSTSSLRSVFSFDYGAIPNQFGFASCSPQFWNLLYEYSEVGLDHRISVDTFDDGCGDADFGTFSSSHYYNTYGPLITGNAGTQLPNAAETAIQYDFAATGHGGTYPSDDDFGTWWSAFSSVGWQGLLVGYVCDEPGVACNASYIPSDANAMHAASASFPNLVTWNIEDANAGGYSPYVNIFVPIIQQLQPYESASLISDYTSSWLGSNSINQVWTYQSCASAGCTLDSMTGQKDVVVGDWPAYMIDTDLVRARAEEWLSFENNLSGELYWDTAAAFSVGTQQPWTNQYVSASNGDGTLFYPGQTSQIGGTTPIPITSMRMKMIREGMEDFEYLHLLSATYNDGSWATAQAKNVFANAYSASEAEVTPAQLYSTRAALACRILTDKGEQCITAGSSPDFSISTNSTTITGSPGTAPTQTVNIDALNGFTRTMALKVTRYPAGGTTSFQPGTVTTSGSSTLTLTISSSAALGTYTLTITGTSGSLAHSQNNTFTISSSNNIGGTNETVWTLQTGTTSDDVAYAVAADSAGNSYIAGATAGSFAYTNQGGSDAFVAKYDSTGTLVWSRQLGTAAQDVAYGVAVDGSGNVFIAGYTEAAMYTNYYGGLDVFLAKYDSSGTRQWIVQLGTAQDEAATGLAVDSSGNVYMAGYTTGALDGVSNLGGQDAWAAEYDTNGNQVWLQQFGTPNDDVAFGVAVDSSGNVDVAGGTTGTMGTSSYGGEDSFVAQLTSSGTNWIEQYGTSSDDCAYGVSVDPNGNVAMGGGTYGSLAWTNAGQMDAFVAEYSSAGKFNWSDQLGTPTDDVANAVAADPQGNVYITGSTTSPMYDRNYGGQDIFFAAYRSDGSRAFIDQMGTASTDIGNGAAFGATNSIFVAGQTNGQLGQTTYGGNDIVLANYQGEGQGPVAVITGGPYSGTAPLAVYLDATTSYTTWSGGWISAFYWDFGDGTHSTNGYQTHTYSSPGTYTATLTATDGMGVTSSTTVAVQAN